MTSEWAMTAKCHADVPHLRSAVESRSPQCCPRETRRVERQAARRRGKGARQPRPSDSNCARRRRCRLFTDPQRNRSISPNANARRARRAAGAAGGHGARQVARLSCLVFRRQADAGTARHSRTVARRRRNHPRFVLLPLAASTAPATASAMAADITTSPWRICAK